MIDLLIYINQMLEENLHYMYSNNGVKFYEITSIDLNEIKKQLEIFNILKKYIRFEENYKSVEGQSLIFNYDRIILKALNNFDILTTPQIKEKIKDFVIVKNYILTNKVGDYNG